MSAIVPFTSDKLPAYLKGSSAVAERINADVVTAQAFPVLSIKGKVFALVRDGVRNVVTKPDDPDEVAQFLEVSVLRANMKARVFYAKKYTEGESEGQRPTCHSYDGVSPAADSEERQADKCQLCPRNVWGNKVRDDGSVGKGTECAPNARLAVAAPDKLDEPYLLRVPPASLSNFKDLVKIGKQRNIPYNALVVKMGFDRDAPSPKLTFKPVGLLSDEAYAKASEMYEDETVEAIVGAGPVRAAQHEAPKVNAVETDELDAALEARAATRRAAAAAATTRASATVTQAEVEEAVAPKRKQAKPAAAAAPAPAPAAAPAPEASAADDDDDLLAGLDSMLGKLDD